MTETSDADHPTILVTDDDGVQRYLASELLKESGYTVVEAGSAKEALQIMESRKDVRLLFTDIQMPPGISGLELAREVHRRWPQVLLVITSGQVQPARAEIADDGSFIRKPYRGEDLIGRIDDVIKKDDATA